VYPDLESIRNNAIWFPFQYDLERLNFTFVRLEDHHYRSASFMDRRLGQAASQPVLMKYDSLIELFESGDEGRDLSGWIFHIGHCGSTLISRALSADATVLPLREPQVLESLANDLHRLGSDFSFLDEDGWDALRKSVSLLLGRRFLPAQTPLIKARSNSNQLIGPILEAGTQRRGLGLHIGLEPYLATMLQIEPPRHDIRTQARQRLREWQAIEGAPRLRLVDLDLPRLAALSWLTTMYRLLAAAQRFPDRFLMLDFDAFLQSPEDHLESLCRFFGFPAACEATIAAFPAIAAEYSKQPGIPFSAAARQAVMDQNRSANGSLIRAGFDWARELAGEVETLGACIPYMDT
jgi:hypothetical protein